MYRSLFYFEGFGFLQNPLTVDLNRLCNVRKGGGYYAALRQADNEEPTIAQFVILGMVFRSCLMRDPGGNRSVKSIVIMPPPIMTDHLESTIGLSFDVWDEIMITQNSDYGYEFGTRRELFFLLPLPLLACLILNFIERSNAGLVSPSRVGGGRAKRTRPKPGPPLQAERQLSIPFDDTGRFVLIIHAAFKLILF